MLTDLAAVVRGQDPVVAEDLYRNSLIVARQVEGDGPQVQVTEAHLAGLLVDVGRFAEAVTILEDLIPRRVALQGPACEGAYRSSLRLAAAFFGLGRLDDTERVAREALGMSQRARLMSFECRDLLGDILESGGRSDEADVIRDSSQARDPLGLTS